MILMVTSWWLHPGTVSWCLDGERTPGMVSWWWRYRGMVSCSDGGLSMVNSWWWRSFLETWYGSLVWWIWVWCFEYGDLYYGATVMVTMEVWWPLVPVMVSSHNTLASPLITVNMVSTVPLLHHYSAKPCHVPGNTSVWCIGTFQWLWSMVQW